MKKEVYFGKNSLRFLYYRYKDSPYYFLGIIVFTILCCLVLIVQVIMPQYDKWFSIRNEVEITQKKIDILKQNVNYMNTLDRALVADHFQVAIAAMPVEKDFSTILAAVNDSALKAGVALEDYSFQLGDLRGEEKTKTSANRPPTALLHSAPAGNLPANTAVPVNRPSGTGSNAVPDGLSPINLSVTISSNINGLQKFVQEIYARIPLAEVVSIDGSEETTTINLRFYQKPLPEIMLKDEEPITRMSPDDQALLEKLSEWRKSIPPPVIVSPEGTESGNMPLF